MVLTLTVNSEFCTRRRCDVRIISRGRCILEVHSSFLSHTVPMLFYLIGADVRLPHRSIIHRRRSKLTRQMQNTLTFDWEPAILVRMFLKGLYHGRLNVINNARRYGTLSFCAHMLRLGHVWRSAYMKEMAVTEYGYWLETLEVGHLLDLAESLPALFELLAGPDLGLGGRVLDVLFLDGVIDSYLLPGNERAFDELCERFETIYELFNFLYNASIGYTQS